MEKIGPDADRVALLYVEDETEARALISESIAFEFPELTIYTAAGGEEGLALFREHRPQLVVTDILMPVMDGLKMASAIIATDEETELIALTAYSDTGFLLNAIETGFSHYVLKPIDYDKLFAAIRKSLGTVELKRRVNEQNERIREFASELERKVVERTAELEASRKKLQNRNVKLREITSRLKEARDRYWSLYNWSPLGYLSLDDDYVIREINITGAHMLGARRAELRGTSIRQHLSPENVALLSEALRSCIEEKHAQVELEVQLEARKFLYIQLHCAPYREEVGRNLYRTAMVDITRLKVAEEKLLESERLLIQQTRLAAMTEMLMNVSHHWRQPLNIVGLKVQELGLSFKYGVLNEEIVDNNIDNIMQVIQRMSRTISDFQSFLTPSSDKVSFSVAELVAKTVGLVEENFRNQGISVELGIAGDPSITGYPNEYGRVLFNLLINARDAVVERGTIGARITVRSRAENGRSFVTVTDNAGGIQEEILDKIFDAYFTTKELGKGAGVGLFIAKNIIEKNMGGRLSVRNVQGGAEFTIEV